MKPSRLWDFLFLYSNYHLEHHYFPRVPFYNLRKLHMRLRPLYAQLGLKPHTYREIVWQWFVLNRAAAHRLGQRRSGGPAPGDGLPRQAGRPARPRRLALLPPPLFGVRNPAAPKRLGSDTRQVGLDVQDRRAVEHVDAARRGARAVASQQLDDRQADRVGAPRRARGEDAVRDSSSSGTRATRS